MIGTNVNSIVYRGNGVATEFAYPFVILDKSDIHLELVSPENVKTELTKDYFVDTVKNVVVYPGYAPGTSNPESDTPPILQDGWRLIIYREVPITQETALDEHWPFNNIEDGLDKLTIICQQLKGDNDRNLKVSRLVPLDTTNLEIPFEAGKTFRVNDDGTGLEVTEDPARAIAITNEDRVACAASASSAASSESNAAASEESASASASTATQKAAVATQKATEASSSATSAADSANTALGYKNAAGVSASEASASQAAALASQKAAASSAIAAADSAISAQSAADTTVASVSAALDAKVQAAQTAESNASASKVAAAASASSASTSATAAASSASAAKASAQRAEATAGVKSVNGLTPDAEGNISLPNFNKSGDNASAGLVPAPSTTAGTTKYLREDGTWTVPPDTNTTYGVATTSANGLMSSTDKAKLDGIASNVSTKAYITETYVNGNAWYRVWSDGWKEQGGKVSGNFYNTITITYPKAFSAIKGVFTNLNEVPFSDAYNMHEITPKNINNSNFTVWIDNSKTATICWRAWGY